MHLKGVLSEKETDNYHVKPINDAVNLKSLVVSVSIVDARKRGMLTLVTSTSKYAPDFTLCHVPSFNQRTCSDYLSTVIGSAVVAAAVALAPPAQ